MDLEIKGISATPRGHSQIASEQTSKGWRSRSQASHDSRPEEVPYLDLGKLGDSDDENHYVRLTKDHPRFCPPDSSSTISWGSPMQTPYAQHYPPLQVSQSGRKSSDRKTEMSSFEQKIVPDNLPQPSNKYKMKYQQYEADIREEYKQYTQRVRDKNKNNPKVEKTERRPLPQNELEDHYEDFTSIDQKVLLQQGYTSKSSSMQHSARKMEAEELAAQRRKQAVVEQVMVDQLSRAVISDPEQDSADGDILEVPFPAFGSTPQRFRKRTLHNTKIKTSAAMTENMLSIKLRFDARIITRNGRDACKELIGFFFVYDKSLTIYEYRHFGKNRTSALPFILKGVYSHQCGRRKGKNYELRDIYIGSNLTFLTAEHHSLSESIMKSTQLNIRIISVDVDAFNYLKETFDLSQQRPSHQEIEDKNVLMAIQDVVKEKMSKRAVRTLTGLAKYFRKLDTKGTGFLNQSQCKEALKYYHLEIPDKVFDSLWFLLDENFDDKVDYGTFMHTFVGEMNENRKALVRKAYMKLDPNKTGTVSMVDVNKFYCAKMHPQVLSGAATEEDITCALLESLQEACSNPKEVSYCEFEDYYEGLSIGILDDEDFINILRNSWGI